MRHAARRDFLKGLAAAIPTSAVLSNYRAMAAPLRKKVKITDVKAMFVHANTDTNLLNQGCHLIQIDIPKAGGLLESKKIADLAELFELPVCAHIASSPLGALASAHCAAAIRDFRAQEFSPGGLSTEAWEKIVIYDGPVIKDGKYRILDKPGLGVELNEDYVRGHLMPGETWWG